jgi:hypothetical protein
MRKRKKEKKEKQQQEMYSFIHSGGIIMRKRTNERNLLASLFLSLSPEKRERERNRES